MRIMIIMIIIITINIEFQGENKQIQGHQSDRCRGWKAPPEKIDVEDRRHPLKRLVMLVCAPCLSQDLGVSEPPRWLTRAFSLLERDDLSVDLRQLHTLQKVGARLKPACATRLELIDKLLYGMLFPET